ncbi:MAG: hypothetical protein U5K81_11360 [Trueperaceae bacterium]|nr:hypothetical protein [Trueperaceae bacterium]
MSRARHEPLGAGRVVLLDDPAALSAHHAGKVVVCGAPATLGTARAMLRHAPALIVLHDAGVGKDRAGVAGLERLADVHIPAVAVAHDSARIGDADDLLAHGIVRHLNEPARKLGLDEGPLRLQLLPRVATDDGLQPATPGR